MVKYGKPVRSGYIGIDSGRLGRTGFYGYKWSSNINASDIHYAYNLRFDKSGVYPSNGNNNRYTAFPLRCLARL